MSKLLFFIFKNNISLLPSKDLLKIVFKNIIHHFSTDKYKSQSFTSVRFNNIQHILTSIATRQDMVVVHMSHVKVFLAVATSFQLMVGLKMAFQVAAVAESLIAMMAFKGSGVFLRVILQTP